MNNNQENNFDDAGEFIFKPDNFEVIMERMRGLNQFFSGHSAFELQEKFQRFQKLGDDGYHVLSVEIIEKFSDFLVGETLNDLVRKDMIDVLWSEEHQDFVFKAKEDK